MRSRPDAGDRPVFRRKRGRFSFLPLLFLGLFPAAALAQEVRLLVQRLPLAGFRYYEARAQFAHLTPGDRLALVREPDNPHDSRAVRVEWRGRKLGYVPRAHNAALAWALDTGEPLSARVALLATRPYRRIEFDVYAE